ncbi:MAG: hypothetical protein WCH11_06735 [Bdellovibrio sp.]
MKFWLALPSIFRGLIQKLPGKSSQKPEDAWVDFAQNSTSSFEKNRKRLEDLFTKPSS